MELKDIISKYPPKRIILIPLAILAFALVILGSNYLSTGSPVNLGMEFTGGTLVTVPVTMSEEQLKDEFTGYPLLEVRKIGNRYMIQFGPMSESVYVKLSQQVNSQFENAEMRYIGPVYSQALLQEAMRYLPLSFLLMAIVVFVVFREPIVSFFVVFCALADIVIAAAAMTATGVSLSLGTVAALLMLIGYSVDTDILLTMRVLKRKGNTDDKIIGAFGTGFTMTTTTIGAAFALFVVSDLLWQILPNFYRMPVIADICVVLLFGLFADIFNTWITNAQLLRWYMARPAMKAGRRPKK